MSHVEPPLKLTVLYGTPKDPAAFEAYYRDVHLPLLAAAPAPAKVEASLGLPGPDGAAPPYHRMFEAWFDGPEHLAAVTGTSAWQRVAADVANFASGGATILLSRRA